MASNSLTGPIPDAVSLWTSIRKLDIGENILSGSIPHDVGSMLDLEWLDLGLQLLTGNIPDHLGSLAKLSWLNLRDNDSLRGCFPDWLWLRSLAGLAVFALQNNAFTGSIPDWFWSKSELLVFSMTYNQLTGSLPDAIASLSGNFFLFAVGENSLRGTIPDGIGSAVLMGWWWAYENRLSGGKLRGLLGDSKSLAHRNRSDFCDLRLRCPSRTPEIARFPKQEIAMLHCDLRVRWKVASDLRFRAAISEPKTPSFCGISGDLAQSTRKSLAIAIVRFWCAKSKRDENPLFPPSGPAF